MSGDDLRLHATARAIDEIRYELARSAEVRKLIAVRTAAAAHLRGIPARHNARALRDLRDEYDTLCHAIALYDRVGVDEIIRCAVAAECA